MTDGTYHQLVLIWVRNPEMFGEYLRRLPPIVARYGGAADLSIRPTAIWADGLKLPDVVNLVHYTDKVAYERFGADPDFRRIAHLRDESVDLMTIEGRLSLAAPSNERVGRVYNVELANYRNGGADAYRRYEQDGEAKMREYGYQVEYVLAPESAPADEVRPDLVKISSFPSASAVAAFEADPMHRTIEQELYPAAADTVVWISGTAAA